MYHKQIEEYLTHYQPELMAELIREAGLQAYVSEQATAMQESRQRIMQQLQEKHPTMSETQRKLEADQMVREMFLPVS